MDGLLTLTLEAHHPVADCHRWYEVRVGRDLLGDWTVCLAYGRTGQAGQQRRFAGASAEELQARVRAHLLRRLSAPWRIGCPYRVTSVAAADEFDAAAWLPTDVMSRFGRAGRSAHSSVYWSRHSSADVLRALYTAGDRLLSRQ